MSSTRIFPLETSYNLEINLVKVVFPEPVVPTSATVCPGLISNEIFFKTSLSLPGYENDTFSNFILPVISFFMPIIFSSISVSCFMNSSSLFALEPASFIMAKTNIEIKVGNLNNPNNDK